MRIKLRVMDARTYSVAALLEAKQKPFWNLGLDLRLYSGVDESC